MRFKVYESLPMAAAEVLSAHGHDAVTVSGEELSGTDDQSLAAHARNEQRVLVTRIWTSPTFGPFPSVSMLAFIVLRLKSQDKLTILSYVERLGATVGHSEPGW